MEGFGVKTVKEMMSELRRIVDRFFVAIGDGARTFDFKHPIISFIVTGVLRIGLAFATYYIVVDWLNIEEQALKISITILAFSLPTLFILWVHRFMNRIVNYRKWSLFWAGVLGIGLAFATYYIVTSRYDLDNDVLESSFTILTLGLPTFFILWLFRTHDVQEQLKKTEENTNNSTFFECARLLATNGPAEDLTETEDLTEEMKENRRKDSFPTKIALEQLAYLRRETNFTNNKIDILTRNLSLNNKTLDFSQLSGLNLSGTKLIKASLINALLIGTYLLDAKLSEADLRNANLSGAYLSRADLNLAKLNDAQLNEAHLSGADLRNANLSEAHLSGADLRGAIIVIGKKKLEGATYNDNTIFTGTPLDNEEARDKEGMRWVPLKYMKILL